jgi:hypothetical protein
MIPTFIRSETNPSGERVPLNLRRVLFHHLPKTAGSTFRTILESYFDDDEVCPAEIDDEIIALNEREHRQYRLFGGHFSFDLIDKYLSDSVWLIFLRDPVERFISYYYNTTDYNRLPLTWIKRFENLPEAGQFHKCVDGLSIEAFMSMDDPFLKNALINYQTRYLTKCSKDPYRLEDANPDDFPLFDQDLLNEAKKNLKNRFLFVGIQEEFELALTLFSMTFGVLPLGQISGYGRNFNPVKVHRRYSIADDIRSAIAENNQMDYELWRYGRRLMHERLVFFYDYYLRMEKSYKKAKSFLVKNNLPVSKLPARWEIEQVNLRRGFYWAEYDGLGRLFRWSGYENPAVLELRFEIPMDTEIEIYFEILAVFQGVDLEDYFFELDGYRLSNVNMISSDDKICVRGVMGGYENHDCRIIHLLKIYGPSFAEDQKRETRTLGIALHAVQIKYPNDNSQISDV